MLWKACYKHSGLQQHYQLRNDMLELGESSHFLGAFSILITPQPTCSNVSTCSGLNAKPCRELLLQQLQWLLYRDIFEQTEKYK